MVITIIYNIPLALMLGFYGILFINLINGGDYASLLVALSSVLVSIFGTREVERRTDFLKYGFLLGIINSLIVISIGLMEKYATEHIIKNIEYSLINGFFNTIAVMGLLPVFEHVFGLTTKFKLLELTDLNAPIFKKMLIKAPGTYNHSIMVANMAEAACKEIGANSLLARVGGYYHDIGKLKNADIYIENRPNAGMKSDLSPHNYSKQIIAHVSKGVKIAKQAGLPEDVIKFIEEHHGDSMMAYFYHQALEQANINGQKTQIKQEDFTYPGPMPQSKETAVVMLADAIEAATRSIHEPTYLKLETMVKKIIYNKLNQGELEYSNLTMLELHKVQKALLQILNGIFHTRIEYPEKEDIKKLENKVKKEPVKKKNTTKKAVKKTKTKGKAAKKKTK
jgi:putative nucleotidyltransferase with HDIG domain